MPALYLDHVGRRQLSTTVRWEVGREIRRPGKGVHPSVPTSCATWQAVGHHVARHFAGAWAEPCVCPYEPLHHPNRGNL